VLLTVADLDVIEAEVEVDETEAIVAKAGQEAELEVDAHVDWVFRGVITEVGHNPVTRQTGAEREGTSYLVKISVQDLIPGVRPGLTCSARIRVDERKDVLTVPIQALELRKPRTESSWRRDLDRPGRELESVAVAVEPPPPEDPAATDGGGASEDVEDDRLAGSSATRREDDEGKVQGVFYVAADDTVWFREVELGITGEKDFELLAGLEEGAEIVVGPFKTLHELEEGKRIKRAQKDAKAQ
jgi:HlyD family secretion protein